MTKIREGRGSSVIYNIRGDNICEGTGSSPEFNIRRKNICKGRGSSPAFNSTDRLDTIHIIAVLYAMGEIRA